MRGSRRLAPWMNSLNKKKRDDCTTQLRGESKPPKNVQLSSGGVRGLLLRSFCATANLCSSAVPRRTTCAATTVIVAPAVVVVVVRVVATVGGLMGGPLPGLVSMRSWRLRPVMMG